MNWNKYDIVCNLNTYLHLVFNFISCGIVLTFTVQRLCSICFPLRFNSSTLQRRSKFFFIALVILGFLIYSPIWSKFESYENSCRGVPEYVDFIERFMFIDSLLTLIIPFLGLLIMNSMIIRTLKNSSYNFVIRTSSNRHFSYEPHNNSHNNYHQNNNQIIYTAYVNFLIIKKSTHIRQIMGQC